MPQNRRLFISMPFINPKIFFPCLHDSHSIQRPKFSPPSPGFPYLNPYSRSEQSEFTMDSSGITSDDDHQQLRIRTSAGEQMQSLLKGLTVSTLKSVANRILELDPIKGRDQFCEAIEKSQSKSPESSNVYAALVAIINSEFPDVGLLQLKRAVLEFKDAYESCNRVKMKVTLKLLAHLVNQAVVYDVLAVDVLFLLLGNPNSDNLKIAAEFCAECGSTLLDFAPGMLVQVMEEFRRVLGMVEEEDVREVILWLLRIEKSGFQDYPGIVDELDIVDVGDQVTHELSLLHDIDIDLESNSDVDVDDDDDDGDGDEVCSWMH